MQTSQQLSTKKDKARVISRKKAKINNLIDDVSMSLSLQLHQLGSNVPVIEARIKCAYVRKKEDSQTLRIICENSKDDPGLSLAA